MSRFRVMLVAVTCLAAAACGTPAGTAAPNATADGQATQAAASTAPTPAGTTTLPVATATAAAGGPGDICATATQLKTALDALKALDAATATTEELDAAVHDVGQAGATLIVQGATAEHLRPLNIGAQLTASMLGSTSASNSERIQVIAQFANTAQAVLDELKSTCS